jgi:hypothetical protein
MTRTQHTLIVIGLLAGATGARAQTCLGYPAQQTGNINFTVHGTVGQDFGGGGATLNVAPLKTGLLLSAGAGANRYVVEPKETVIGYGGVIGWERYNRDNLIWCPVVAVRFTRGEELDLGEEGLQRRNSTELAAGLGAGFELERRGPLSFNPFLSARYTRVKTHVEGNVIDSTGTVTGVVFAAGLGVRINDAFQITPSFHGATFEDALLFFDLRFSIALRTR